MKRTALSLAAMTALAACGQDPMQPVVARVPEMTAAVAAGASKRVVEFNGKARKDFAARVAQLGGTVDFISENGGFAGISGLTDDAAAALGREAGVGSVYEDQIVQLNDQSTISSLSAESIDATSTNNPAAAIGFGLQWNMRAISANTEWAKGNLGSSAVTAAILDTGIDYDQPDFAGLVDLTRSVSFVPSDNALIAALLPGRNFVDDLAGHGSNVAAQVSSNAIIFAGVSSKTRLMAVKVIGATGGGSVGSILAGVIWAADNGADVANLSFGFIGGIDKAGAGRLVGLFNKVLNYAHRAGMVIVVSAGNEARNLDGNGFVYDLMCEAPHVICVSATGPTASANAFFGPWVNVDAPATYSNIGRKSITVAAPGGTIRGWITSVCAKHLIAVVGGAIVFPCPPPGATIPLLGFAGTSQAAPHVTGVVAQLIAKYGKGQPAQIKHLLLNGVDDLGPPGADDAYGAGRVNLTKALSQ